MICPNKAKPWFACLHSSSFFHTVKIIVTKQAGDYEAEFYMQPSNPVTTENRLQYAVSVNGVPMQILDAVTDDFKIEYSIFFDCICCNNH